MDPPRFLTVSISRRLSNSDVLSLISAEAIHDLI